MDAKTRMEKELEEAKQEFYGNTDEPAPEPEEEEGESVEEAAEEVEAVPEEEEPAPEEEVPDDLQKKVEDLEKRLKAAEDRYSVLQGKYNAEVPRLHQQLAEAQKAPKEETPEPENLDLGALGEDYEEVNALKEYYDKEISALRGEVQSLKGQLKDVGGKQVQSDQDRYFSSLDETMPDWEEVGRSEEFIAWCREVDPLSGRPRQALLDDAREQMDAKRTVNILKAFRGESVPPKEEPKKESPLNRQVVPDRKRAVSTPPKEEKPVYTQAQYEKALNDLEKAMQKGAIKQETFDKKMKEYHSAYMEGRVQ